MLSTSGFKIEKKTFYKIFGDRATAIFETLKYRYAPKIGAPVITKLYRVDSTYIYLPRCFASFINTHGNVKLDYVGLITLPPDVGLTCTLFDNQILVVNKLINELTTRPVHDRAITLNMKAGLGKTFVASGVIASLGRRTLYIVPKRPLAQQAVGDLRICFNCNPNKINLFGNNTNKDDFITVIVINTALKQPKSFFDRYTLCIMDEVHMYCSEKRRVVFRLACLPLVLAMSATTSDRKDQLDVVFQKEVAIGGIIHADELPGWQAQEVEFESQVDICYYKGPPEYTKVLTHETTEVIFTPYMHKQFMEDQYRLTFAINEITTLYEEGHNIFVFAEERNMLDAVRDKLVAYSVAIEEDSGKFIGGISNDQITEISKCRIILTTYGYSSTGVSIDKQTAIVFLTSRRANMKQIIARILRRSGNRDVKRRIIDIVDASTPMRWQLLDRQQAYDFYGMDCINRYIKWSDIEIK